MAIMFNGFNLPPEDLLAGQDPKGLVMCFFIFSDRVRIQAIRVDGMVYRRGRLVAPPIDPETGCTAEEMDEILVRRPATPGWTHPIKELDEEVA
jgi:hypothetical protein